MIHKIEALEEPRRNSGALITPSRVEHLQEVLDTFGLPPKDDIWQRMNRAFIHRSYRTEANLDEDNERLEFLGDSVIGLATTEYLVETYRNADEGWLSKLRASVVSRAILGEVGRKIELGNYLLLGAGEEKTGGRQRISILGSTLEAVCGVLYLHYLWGELREPLRNVVVIPALELVQAERLVDYKSRLQEWSQRHYQDVPEYTVIGEGGPDHQKTFQVEVRVGDRIMGRGAGRRKKLAENDAARMALCQLGEIECDDDSAGDLPKSNPA